MRGDRAFDLPYINRNVLLPISLKGEPDVSYMRAQARIAEENLRYSADCQEAVRRACGEEKEWRWAG